MEMNMTIGEVIEHFWPIHLSYLVLGGGFIGLVVWLLLAALLLFGFICVCQRSRDTAFFSAAHLHIILFVFVVGILPAYAAYAFLPSSPEEGRQFVIEIFSRALLAVLLGEFLLAVMAIAVRMRCKRGPCAPRFAWVSLILIHLDFVATWLWRLPIGNNILWR